MCLASCSTDLDRRKLLSCLAQFGGGAALTTLGPVVWAQSGASAGPPLPVEVAGVKLPLSALVRKAAADVHGKSPPLIYFHTLRTYVLGALYAEWVSPKLAFKDELLLLACLFHDIGLTEAGAKPGRPFEQVSGEYGRDFVMREGGFSAGDADLVYRGIALHVARAWNAPEPEVRLVMFGALSDLYARVRPRAGAPHDDFPTQAEIDAIATALPRHRFKATWIDMLRAHVARTGDPGDIAGFAANPPLSPSIAASRWPE